jgi:FMN-dependent NADH-azoreductase
MASILLITASPYGAASRGAKLAIEAVDNLLARDSTLTLVERDLSVLAEATLHTEYADAIVGGHAHDAEAFALSEVLIKELEAAAYVVIATPMHNYTVSASLKLWIDFVLRYGRSFAPIDGIKTGLLIDRPTLVVVTSGGLLTGTKTYQPDHLTGYLADVLATIGIRDLRYIYLEGLANQAFAEKVTVEARQKLMCDPAFGREPAF